MELSEKDQNVIEAYLLGRLSAEDAAYLEERRANPGFAAALRTEEQVMAAIDLDGDLFLKDMLEREEMSIRKQAVADTKVEEVASDRPVGPLSEAAPPKATTTGARIRRLPGRHWLSRVAAVGLLVVAAIWLFKIFSPATPLALYDDYFAPYENVVEELNKGSVSESEALRQKAYAAYESGDYAAALQGFEAILADTADADTEFYRANALLELGRAEEALPILDELARKPDFNLAAHSQWYAALAELALKRPDQAKIRLEKIINRPPETLKVQLEQLYKQL